MRRLSKVFITLVIVLAMLVTTMPGADAIFISYGDSSWTFGTPLDDDGNRTVCSDGFELIAVSTPNGDTVVGEPTGSAAGDTTDAPNIGVFHADLIDNFSPDGFFDPNLLDQAGAPGGFTYIDPLTGQPAADLYGFLQVEVVLSDTFSSIDGISKPVAGIGSDMFVPPTALPVGDDIVLVTDGLLGFGSHRRVTVVDCSEPPTAEVQVEVHKSDRIKADKPNKQLKVEIINDGTFDISGISDVEINGNAVDRTNLKDVDGDGDTDALVKLRMRNSGVECGDTSITVTGTLDGAPFETIAPIATRCK